jgi:phage tail sheath protein FI
MPAYKTPGTYIEEIPKLPSSIASVETAIPAFIGYTQTARLKEDNDLFLKPHRITSMPDYEQHFGLAMPEVSIEVSFNLANPSKIDVQGKINPATASKFLMYYSLQLFFANGGGPCYITSVGSYTSTGGIIINSDLQKGLDEMARIDEVTLILFPDGLNIAAAGNYYALYKEALDQCAKLKDRFAVMDVWIDSDIRVDNVQVLRDFDFGTIDTIKYGAVYYPRLYTRLDYYYTDERAVKINGVGGAASLDALKSVNNAYYFMAKNAITNIDLLLPASSGVAGQYATVDKTRGVWKAPADVVIDLVVRPEKIITDKEQTGLSIDTSSGKSINIVRSFPGRGPAIIWGARTLAGNDNEWRYIPVRRFFNMVEESASNATKQFVFEPNDRNTWLRIKSMIENYLILQWKAGALMGASAKDAFFVHVGRGETMTEQDILEGRMIVEIGMAVIRPAEFIILRFMHKMLAYS